MSRKGDTPSRGDIVERVEKHTADMAEKAESLDSIATDAETVRDTLESLDPGGGTSEGVDEVTHCIESAEQVTVEIFDREDAELEEIQGEAEEHEGEIRERTEVSQSDMEKVSDAAGKVELQETSSELDRAREGIADDIEFLDDQSEQARAAREENERLQQDHRARVQSGRG